MIMTTILCIGYSSVRHSAIPVLLDVCNVSLYAEVRPVSARVVQHRREDALMAHEVKVNIPWRRAGTSACKSYFMRVWMCIQLKINI